ncbi:hypothetical protein GUJ93_ZPchr0006g44864 [Zizania palustris]|uniref:Uncharacterized protein n=1 Tax=Zizania palustris TaxID=103762 RepID=A0A8J5TE71_ZIZPA|nr:hypothetical protein GUJ93_ZPchr0006g44864 [Zizania palustris]
MEAWTAGWLTRRGRKQEETQLRSGETQGKQLFGHSDGEQRGARGAARHAAVFVVGPLQRLAIRAGSSAV